MRRTAALLLALALGASACASSTDADGSPTTTAASAPDPVPPADEPDDFAVGRRTLELVDESRSTAADDSRDLAERPERTLPVLLLYPSADPVRTPTTPVDDAPPAAGRFPLVVFSHGVTATGPAYEGRIQEWARAGYVVAAPTYPLSSGPGGQISDYVNQPADVSFVIDELLALPADDPLAGHIDPDAVAAAGHSLGAITTIGVGLNSCCADDRLDAAVAISGLRLPFPDGDFDALGPVPILAVHGARDETVPVSGSDSLVEDALGPAHYLRFPEGDHTGFLFAEGALVDEVVVAFLDAYLKGEPAPLEQVPERVEASGQATYEHNDAAG